MPGKVFISYRRGDEPGYTQALFQRLEAAFGHSEIFMDVEGYIKAGDDFAVVIQSQVATCDVLLAVIGPRWINAHDKAGQRRLDKPDDFVVLEIASALEQDKRVIPVLVNEATMIQAEDLPDRLRPLARRQAVTLAPRRFGSDCRGLIREIRAALGMAEPAPGTPTNADDLGERPPVPASNADGERPARRPQPAAPAGAKSSYLAVGATSTVLAILSAWVALTFFRDIGASSLVASLFSAASLFFSFVGFAALRRGLKARSESSATPGAADAGITVGPTEEG